VKPERGTRGRLGAVGDVYEELHGRTLGAGRVTGQVVGYGVFGYRLSVYRCLTDDRQPTTLSPHVPLLTHEVRLRQP
jgi:hypothetical protein